MMIVRRHALEAIRRKLPETADILVLRRQDADIRRCRLCLELAPCALPKSCRRQLRRIGNSRQKLFLHAQRLLDGISNRCLVEIRIRDRNEKVQRDAVIDGFRNRLAVFAQRRRHSRKPLRHIDQEILQPCDLRLLATDTHLRTGLAARRLLTLKAKHLVFHI